MLVQQHCNNIAGSFSVLKACQILAACLALASKYLATVCSADRVRFVIALVPDANMPVLLLVRLVRLPCRLLEAEFAAEAVAGARAPTPCVTEPTTEVALFTAPEAVFAALEAAETPDEIALLMLPKTSQLAGARHMSSTRAAP